MIICEECANYVDRLYQAQRELIIQLRIENRELKQRLQAAEMAIFTYKHPERVDHAV